MPIEIKELHIKISVNTTSKQALNSPGKISAAKNSNVEKEMLVAECVEQVLQILEKKRER